MDYIISLWFVLMWEPLKKWFSESVLVAWIKRFLVFSVVYLIVLIVAVSIYTLLKHGAQGYASRVNTLFSDKYLKEERQKYWAQRKQEKREKAKKRIDEKRAREAGLQP